MKPQKAGGRELGDLGGFVGWEGGGGEEGEEGLRRTIELCYEVCQVERPGERDQHRSTRGGRGCQRGHTGSWKSARRWPPAASSAYLGLGLGLWASAHTAPLQALWFGCVSLAGKGGELTGVGHGGRPAALWGGFLAGQPVLAAGHCAGPGSGAGVLDG
jgi:hypothetical protein